jgi:hypothetical protein
LYDVVVAPCVQPKSRPMSQRGGILEVGGHWNGTVRHTRQLQTRMA